MGHHSVLHFAHFVEFGSTIALCDPSSVGQSMLGCYFAFLLNQEDFLQEAFCPKPAAEATAILCELFITSRDIAK